MDKKNSKVFIIDDDAEIRQSLSLLLMSAGYQAESYSSINEFLAIENYNGAGCILLDVFLGGKTGIELQADIETKFESLPIIYITGHGDIPMSVEAMKKGAVNFLQKPVDSEKLIAAINEAIIISKSTLARYNELDRIRSLIHSLTAREFEIFRYVITGKLNKQIAADLGIAEHTVKNHRLKITEKLGVKSLPELVYIADKLHITRKKLPNILNSQ
jgi:FixJ family two-component response regulator